MIEAETTPGASNPGHWMEEAGGGGFNAARNLSRLGFEVRIISPRGGDVTGEAVAAAARQAGVEDTPFVFLDRRTPSYTAILERDGNLVIALADMDLYKLFTPRRLRVRSVREAIRSTDIILCDANLPEDTLTAIGLAARVCGKMLAAIAISPAKAVKLVPPRIDDVKDVTGAGDAMASGYLSAIAEGATITQALRLGAAAAALTVQSPFATSPDLSKNGVELMSGLVPEAETLA